MHAADARTSSRRGLVRACWRALLVVVALLSPASPSAAFLQFSSPGFVEDVVAQNLPFAVGMTFAPDGRMFLALQGGVVRVYQNGQLLPTPFIDISSQVNHFGDRGLLGIAVHPQFPTQPYVYLLFTWEPSNVTQDAIGARVARLIRVEADPAQGYNVAKSGMTVGQNTPGGPGHWIMLGQNSTAENIGNPNNGRDKTKASCMSPQNMGGTPVENCIPSDEDSHTIGTVKFGLDGSLFVSAGDGSNYVDVDHRALRSQMLDSLAGKILRIDPNTALGLIDNPHYDAACPGCNRSKVYDRGLRNPFRFTIHPVTNEPYIGDVGWSLWEEINTGKGRNFGWPCYEGGLPDGSSLHEGGATTSVEQIGYKWIEDTFDACAALYAQGLSVVRAPIWTYDHDGPDGAGGTDGASANAGTFYAGTAYPPQYQDALFILDYNRRWIRYLTFDALGNASIHNFAKDTVDGPVQLLEGPDTNLYAMMLAPNGQSQVRRIRYVGSGNTPPTAIANATPTIGTAPLFVTFSSLGSFDPDAQPLGYEWDFGDGQSSTSPNPTHTYASSGVFTATLTVSELTAPFDERSDEVVVTVGTEPPLASITAPLDGTTYRIGDQIDYAGSATSGGQPVPDSQLSWNLRLHHNQHVHFSPLATGVASGSFDIIEHGDNTFYDLCLTATVPPDLTDTQCVTLLPELTQITLATDPPGLLITYSDEGVTQASPLIVNVVVGSEQTATVPPIQAGRTFTGWADGVSTINHPFVVGLTPATYTAEYVNVPPVAVVGANPQSGAAPLDVSFTGSGSSDPEGGTLTYLWEFGDTATSTQANPTHLYSTGGTFQARLTVRDQLDGVDTETVNVVVSGATACADGLDNDGDGGADLLDGGCTGASDISERGSNECDDGVDNDGDGRTDYLAAGGGDPGCRYPLYTTESPQCQDGLDNDGQAGIDFDGGVSLDLAPVDGLIDAQFNPATPPVGAPDPQCTQAWKMRETPSTACGLGFEVVLALVPLAALRGRRRR
jgi:PKD repeat protein